MKDAKVEARGFANGDRLAVVVTQSAEKLAATRIRVLGYVFQESDGVGEIKVEGAADGVSVQAGRDGIAVLVFRKQ